MDDGAASLPTLAERIKECARDAYGLYHRLVLVAGPPNSGKTVALREVSASASAPLVNVNLELSRRMLDLTERQRTLQLPRLLGEMVGDAAGGLILLDNLEILFDVHLGQDPLRLLQGLSRNKTVVASWPGAVVDGFLTYAVPGHPEFRRYPAGDLQIVETQCGNK